MGEKSNSRCLPENKYSTKKKKKGQAVRTFYKKIFDFIHICWFYSYQDLTK